MIFKEKIMKNPVVPLTGGGSLNQGEFPEEWIDHLREMTHHKKS